MKYNNYKNYQEAVTNIRKLADMCETQHSYALERRQQRHLDIDLDLQRKDGYLAPDEIYIPTHIIDSNMRREQAKYVSYMVNARRTAVFTSVDHPSFNTGPLERDFTERCRYDGWQIPVFRVIDCMQLHGYSVAEIQFDDTKPGHFAVEAVNYEDIAFPDDTRDIQACGMLAHRHYFTREQLIDMTKTREFSMKQVEELVGEEPVDEQSESLFKVEKVMFRDAGGIINVAWTCVAKSNDWLRKPRPLFLGRRDINGEVFESDYPYVMFHYMISEDIEIKNCVGRSYMDRHSQEAISSLMSSFVTAHRRASNFYFAKEAEDPNNTNAQTSVQFVPGALIDSNIKQFQLRPPDSTMLSAIQTLVTQNAQEQSQTNYAAMNRRDSRKTATEIQTANSEAQMLSATQVALFSISLKQLYSKCWEIYKSRAIDGLVETHIDLSYFVDHVYNLKPSGDSDVIERQEKMQKMMSMWQIVANTGIASSFLKNMLGLMFPEEAPQYEEELAEDNTKIQLIQQLNSVVQSLTVDQQTGQLNEEAQPFAQQLQALQQQVQTILGGGQQAAPKQQMGGLEQSRNNAPSTQTASRGAGEANQ